jgi:glyoxylase-like metal-dependent hydrolase (beta-lactamase superfamily II)
LDGVILTHDHADAVLGLDDLRDLQRYTHTLDPVTQVCATIIAPFRLFMDLTTLAMNGWNPKIDRA